MKRELLTRIRAVAFDLYYAADPLKPMNLEQWERVKALLREVAQLVEKEGE